MDRLGSNLHWIAPVGLDGGLKVLFRLLVFLVENPGRALTKDEIMAAVWPGTFVSDNSLARAVAQARREIDDDPKAPRYVETVPTVGYRFIGECREEGDSGAADVLYWKTDAPGIWRRALAGGGAEGLAKNAEELLIPDFWPTNQLGGFEPVAGGVYYVGSDTQGKPGAFRFFDYATQRSVEVASAVAGLRRGFAVAPDQRQMLFAASAEVGGELVTIGVQ